MGSIANLFGYLLNFFYNLFDNYGIAIIVFSVVLKIILIPITWSQQKSMKKSGELQGKLKEIQNKYKNNPEKLEQEMRDLYKRENMNPFSGCLSSIVQILIILSVFWLVSKPLTYMKKVEPNLIEKYTNEIKEDKKNIAYPEISIIQKKSKDDEKVFINMDFCGLDLSLIPNQHLNDYKVYIIPVLYVITSFISIKLTNSVGNNKKVSKEKEENNSKDENLEAMEEMSKSMSYMFPIMSISIAFMAPLGLALYWLVSNILMIIERFIIVKIEKVKEEKKNA